MSRKHVQKTGIISQLPLAIKTGKYVIGFKQSIKSVINNKSKCVVVASNMPEHMRRKMEYYCALAGSIPIKFFSGSNNDLSSLAGLEHRTCVLSILDQGEAELAEVKSN